MHGAKCQLVDTFCDTTLLFFFTNFIDALAETGTASFIFEMQVLRAAMTWRKTVSCLHVYLP